VPAFASFGVVASAFGLVVGAVVVGPGRLAKGLVPPPLNSEDFFSSFFSGAAGAVASLDFSFFVVVA
jgi:predicted lysophospholipase L1 biosynthesis ABC-type transport system permease subunit